MTDAENQPPGETGRRGSGGSLHPAIKYAYGPRLIIHLVSVAMVIATLVDAPRWFVGATIGLALAWPHLTLLIGRIVPRQKRFAYDSFFVDGTLMGCYLTLCGFALVPSVTLLTVSLASQLLMGGVWLLKRTFTAVILIGLAGYLWLGGDPMVHLDGVPVWLSMVLLAGYAVYISYAANESTKRMVSIRKEVVSQNKRIAQQKALMENINSVAHLVNSTLDLDHVLEAIRDNLDDIFDFNQMSVLFIHPEENALRLDRSVGTISSDVIARLSEVRVPLDSKTSTFAHTVQRNCAQYIPDVLEIRPTMDELGLAMFRLVPAKSMLSYPLVIDDQIIGVLSFCNTRRQFHLEEAQISIIGRYVTYVATAIRNAQMYEEVRAMEQSAEKANLAKSQFLANMSHELRTPMNAVIGYTEMLEEEAEDQGLDDFIPDLQRIRSSGQHLLRLINDVLDLSKIEADRVELYSETASVDELIDELVDSLKPVIEANENHVMVKRSTPLGEIYTDVGKLRQALTNLLSNAAKFTTAGRIRIEAQRFEKSGIEWLEIAVQDSGIGMNEEQLARIFQPFTQADASTTRKYGGTGLGLVISQRFIELMGGTLTVTSREGHGSRFTIRIPARVGTAEAKPTAVETRPGPASRTDSPGPGAPLVLVIDDDEAARDLLRRLLERQGYRVRTAADGEIGLELAAELRPDAITLDALMPGHDGWTVLSHLKSDAELSRIPVIMISMLDEPQKAYALGATDYLTKPIDRDRILSILASLKAGEGRTALVVEDDLDSLALMEKWLTREGWDVLSAGNGIEALEVLDDRNADLIVLDLMMPEMDGFSFLDELRQGHPQSDTPVIVVTAKELGEEDLQRLEGRVENIIQKSGSPRAEVLAEVERIVKQTIRTEEPS